MCVCFSLFSLSHFRFLVLFCAVSLSHHFLIVFILALLLVVFFCFRHLFDMLETCRAKWLRHTFCQQLFFCSLPVLSLHVAFFTGRFLSRSFQIDFFLVLFELCLMTANAIFELILCVSQLHHCVNSFHNEFSRGILFVSSIRFVPCRKYRQSTFATIEIKGKKAIEMSCVHHHLMEKSMKTKNEKCYLLNTMGTSWHNTIASSRSLLFTRRLFVVLTPAQFFHFGRHQQLTINTLLWARAAILNS